MMMHHPEVLYHFTCGDAAPLIRRDGMLKPGSLFGTDHKKLARLTAEERRAVTGIRSFIWLTDIAPPAPAGPLGLTRQSLSCDRTAHCFQVYPDWNHVTWWMYARKLHPEMRALESEPASMPAHWFVSEELVPIYAELDARHGGPIHG